MEEHLIDRPNKNVYSAEKVADLTEKAVEKIKNDFLPDDDVRKIFLIGSSVKGSFGEYEPPGFRGSLFSDFDFIIFVSNDYKIPGWLEREPDGRPFPNDEMNLAYRSRKYVENKYDAEIFFVRDSLLSDQKICELGELAGIPMTKNSQHKHIAIYKR